MEHKVALVVDPKYGERILEIADQMHVWVVSSQENWGAAKSWYDAHVENDLSFQKGVTTFNYDSSHSPKEIVSNIIETLNDHHGPDWTSEGDEIPEWSYIEVHGCKLCGSVKSILQEYGVNHFIETDYGFLGKTNVSKT